MKIGSLFRILKNYKDTYQNYFSILARMFLARKETATKDVYIKVLLKDGRILNLPIVLVKNYVTLSSSKNPNIHDVDVNESTLIFTFYDKTVRLQTDRFFAPDSVFIDEDYKPLNVKGNIVIDIGMNIGDSSIYFALNGARKIIGLEPRPYQFSIAEKNMKLNDIANCILLNAGYGRDDEIKIDPDSKSIATDLIPSNQGQKIKIYSLSTIFNDYNLDGVFIKMDCEGCEYALLDEPDSVFGKINAMVIEYHYGCEKLLEKFRNMNYSCKYTAPIKIYNKNATDPNMSVGYIYAFRETRV